MSPAMKAIQPAGPCRLLGWSLGELIAMEIAHRLEQRGDTLDFIGLIDAKTPAPAAPGSVGKKMPHGSFDPVVRPEDRSALTDALARKQWDAPTATRLGAEEVADRLILAARHVRGLVSAGIDRSSIRP